MINASLGHSQMRQALALLRTFSCPVSSHFPSVPARHLSCSAASSNSSRSRESLVRPIIATPIKLITVSKGSGSDISSEYEKKIARYANFSATTIKPNPKGSADPLLQKEGEAERVLKMLSPRDYVVILDERGREMSSEGFTAVLEEAGNRGASSLVFCIGGPVRYMRYTQTERVEYLCAFAPM